MKRVIGVLFGGIIALLVVAAQPVSAASTNNFRITSFNIEYELSRDSQGRSVLKTTEIITALFPDTNQNHGLERAIPTSYNGHSVGLTINEVSNTNGNSNYSTSDAGGVKTIRIGDAHRYVHGSQTYRIMYTQHDVTRFFADTGRDEWYWDTNGTQWRVPIDNLTVSVTVSPDIAQRQAAEPVCYQGNEGSNQRCNLQQTTARTYTVQASNLAAGQNVTLAFGFQKDTFSGYALSVWDWMVIVWGIFQLVTTPLVIVAVIVAAATFYRRHNRTKELEPIVVEYIPPRDTSVTVAGQLVGSAAPGSTFTAQLIDLAVRRYVAIIETRAKSFWKPAEYDIAVTSALDSLLEEEKEIISDMFDHLPTVGERLALKSLGKDTSYRTRSLDNSGKLKHLIESTYGLREKVPASSRPFYRWAIALGIVGIATASLLIIIAAVIFATLGVFLRPLTDKGLAIRRYTLGLDRYIKASEADRLAFLQGPDTAEKVGYDVDTANPGEMIKLYERVLPYAILFGHQKEWATRLGALYEKSQAAPGWYSGTSSFNAALFASTMTNITTASAYSSGVSSGSGGSGGGGFSGGGGGGGGGGGW